MEFFWRERRLSLFPWNESFFFLLGVLCLKLRLQYALGADAVHIEIQAQN